MNRFPSSQFEPQWAGLEHVGRAWTWGSTAVFRSLPHEIVYLVHDDGYLYYTTRTGEIIDHSAHTFEDLTSSVSNLAELPRLKIGYPADAALPEGL